jgi:hypothetical protein
VITAIVLLFLGGVVGGQIALLWSVIRANRRARRRATTLLEEAAEQMIAAPPQQWTVWCLHLLKAIDVRVDDEPYRAALAGIQAQIAARLQNGRWPGDQAAPTDPSGTEG